MPVTQTPAEQIAATATALATSKAAEETARKEVASAERRYAKKQGETKLAQQAFDAAMKTLTK